MCGIAGVVDLAGRRPVAPAVIRAMADALAHRGPDEEGFLERPGLALASRRLSIVGLLDGQQPLANEDRTVFVIFNGELFDHAATRAELEGRGHHFLTHCDTEVIPHLWEEYQEGTFERLHGQFALALWDERRRQLVLGRDRFGICPLHWTRQGDWLLFASEIKALLASGMVQPRPDLRGIQHLFTFFAVPGPVTCFEGVQALLPGHYLEVRPEQAGRPGSLRDRTYWAIDFPQQGHERREHNTERLVDEFEAALLQAVERRLRADVPVVAYLSGGIDSSLVVALACRVLGHPIPAFTIAVQDAALDESHHANLVARFLHAEPILVPYGRAETLRDYPPLIQAAEAPVIDTACGALLALARQVHAHGYKVTLTGEGSDEWLAGYPWFKTHRLLGLLDLVPGLPLGDLARRAYSWLTGPPGAWVAFRRDQEAAGGPNAWLEIYGLVSLSRQRFFSPRLREALAEHSPFADLGLDLERLGRWHPLHRSLYFGGRIMLPGLLLNAKGDRVAMASSVETRYPFLDEDLFAFLAALEPRWKLRGLQDKYLLRLVAERWLPRSIAWRPKAMFRAPFDSFYTKPSPVFVDELLSEASLHRTGYFDARAVAAWRQTFRSLPPGSYQRIAVEMGLVGVIATQLWHHTFIEPALADLPSLVQAPQPMLMA